MKKIFITATDTDAGKTFLSSAILIGLKQNGKSVVGFKPVSAGCEITAAGLRNEDALALQRLSCVNLTYDQVNPIAFAKPVAPHLAAQELQQTIDYQQISLAYTSLCNHKTDYVVTEGAGGWRLPLSHQQFLSDLAIEQQMQVILIVPIRLGCLNHAVLSAQAIQHDGLTICGWIANVLDDSVPLLNENIESLQRLLNVPFIGRVPKLSSPQAAVSYLDFSLI